MAGIYVFHSLSAAFHAGYQVYEKTPHGYIVRTRLRSGWALALVQCEPVSATIAG